MIPTPFISDRRTKGHETHPRPLPKGGECRRLGEIWPALELARFQNKVEKERPKQVSPDTWLLLFRRICYPPELNIRIFNPQ